MTGRLLATKRVSRPSWWPTENLTSKSIVRRTSSFVRSSIFTTSPNFSASGQDPSVPPPKTSSAPSQSRKRRTGRSNNRRARPSSSACEPQNSSYRPRIGDPVRWKDVGVNCTVANAHPVLGLERHRPTLMRRSADLGKKRRLCVVAIDRQTATVVQILMSHQNAAHVITQFRGQSSMCCPTR